MISRKGLPLNPRLVQIAWFCLVLCLIIAAAASRFHELTKFSLRDDEAVASEISAVPLSELLQTIQERHSTPALYPLALWLAQKVEISTFSVRVLPAAASALSVAAMLLLFPAAGLRRDAVLPAALLALVSVAALRHAHDAREYSIDALLAALMIAALLRALRDGKNAPLCATLFIAPLLQYGLVLFGAAVIGALLLARLFSGSVGPPPASASANKQGRAWLQRVVALALPAGFFLAGCALSYGTTGRHHLAKGFLNSGGYMRDYLYYPGSYDFLSTLSFASDQTWKMLNYHLPPLIAALTLTVLALWLVAGGVKSLLARGRAGNAEPAGPGAGIKAERVIFTLFLLALIIAIAAAVARLYPLGAVRQNIYLGPIAFIAAGCAISALGRTLSAFTPPAWLAPVLLIAAVGAIGYVHLRNNPYQSAGLLSLEKQNALPVISTLWRQANTGDQFFMSAERGSIVKFYLRRKLPVQLDNIHYGQQPCWDSDTSCAFEIVDKALHQLGPKASHWLVFHSWNANAVWQALEQSKELVSVTPVVSAGHTHLYRLSRPTAETNKLLALRPGAATFHSHRAVFWEAKAVNYVMEPCSVADIKDPFFLHIFPVDATNLPEFRQPYGFGNRDFHFRKYGSIVDGKCLATVPLPDYDIAEIKIGQFRLADGEALWRATLVGNPGPARTD